MQTAKETIEQMTNDVNRKLREHSPATYQLPTVSSCTTLSRQLIQLHMTGRTRAVCIRCGDPHSSHSSHYVIVLILLARDKLRFVLYPLLPCRACSQRGSCLDRACLIVRRRYQVLFHVSSALFTFLVQPLVGSM